MEPIWITDAKHIRDFELELHFSNGQSGRVDLKDHLDKPIFEPLRCPTYFKNFKLNAWTIAWDNGADFAPEFLYELVKAPEERIG